MTDTLPHRPPAVEDRPDLRSRAGRLLQGSGGALAGLIVLFIVLSLCAPNFLSGRNLVNVVDQVTVIGILALGATAVIITGGIDLSVGSVLALSTMVLGWLSHDGGWPLPLAMLVAVAVGAAAGALNGLGVTMLRLPPFIATLAMMSIARGLANLITDGQQIVGYPEWFYELSSNRYLGFLAVTALLLIVLYVAGWAFLTYRRSGRAIYAIGGGHEVARLAGIRVRSVTTWVYVTAGALAGVGGIVLASRLDSSQPSAGTGYELDVIAAVVIGGASLVGGSGRVTGTIVGVLIIGVLRNGLNLLGVSPFIQQIVIGLVIALAVAIDVLRRRRA
ncbi:ABC transporter permease [Frigoribacterium sp. VKM Ac-2530]|uniref:ABC transporter permease n=1 Tax=Frigoribacterium sp. VKM Ac-2530 TaxID=2783822 RepID=UPI00188C8300|nr:ABC transporter permease [Frigoribacterium sp. VKM Ac-2530]MBF4580586.1 ABC transporter permease [Frigoribacterium sp. VKM Ac-2530]